MAKDIREQLQEIMSANTFVGRFVDSTDLRGLPANKIDILLDNNLNLDSFAEVPVLPRVEDAKEGVFYVLPNDTINFVSEGTWHTVVSNGIQKVKKSNGTALDIDPTDLSVTLPQDDLSDGFYYTTSTLSTVIGAVTVVGSANIASFNKDDLVLGETTLYDSNGTLAVVTSLYDSEMVNATTMSTSSSRSELTVSLKSGKTMDATVGRRTNFTSSDFETWSWIKDKPDETFVYDANGSLGIITVATQTPIEVITVKTLIPHYIDSDTMLHLNSSYRLPVKIGETINYNTSFIEGYDSSTTNINKTLVYDDAGTIGVITALPTGFATITTVSPTIGSDTLIYNGSLVSPGGLLVRLQYNGDFPDIASTMTIDGDGGTASWDHIGPATATSTVRPYAATIVNSTDSDFYVTFDVGCRDFTSNGTALGDMDFVIWSGDNPGGSQSVSGLTPDFTLKQSVGIFTSPGSQVWAVHARSSRTFALVKKDNMPNYAGNYNGFWWEVRYAGKTMRQY